MKRTLFFIVLIVMMFGLSAQNYMLIYKTDGSIVVCGTAEIDSLKFVPMGNFEEPTVTTNEVENITFTSAVCGGKVTYDGGVEVTAKGICWSTKQNPTIEDNKTIDGLGFGSYTSNLSNLLENTTYYVRAYATNVVGTSYGKEKIFTTQTPINGHYYVDLGLPSGLKWATCNVGADSPEEYGDYFAWGETVPKEEYTIENSLTYELSISDLESQGYINGEGSLTSSHDAATANWGGPWRMPTKAEQQELLENCELEWTTQNCVNGYKVTSKINGNSIFLPATGFRYNSSLYDDGNYGYYWSSTPDDEYNISWCFGFHSSYYGMSDNDSYSGQSIRPVLE